DSAENKLREVLNDLGVEYFEAEGEAAFYGPKLDVEVKPAVGPEVTLSTCQLDFLLPRRFELNYIDSNGEKQIPVVLHRAIFGTFDRFTAFIIEETKGNFPTWLAPVQVKTIPVNPEYQGDYAKEINDLLIANGIRAELDDRNEKLGYRLREAQTTKVPYTLILGDAEKENQTISYRLHGEKDTTTLSKEEFVELIKNEIASRGLRK
ncbi:MAG: threonine--tRNA ligase, partial [Bacilli bacterium]|nr:threonine--tRNA ligase [Bacilli bacterium]